MFTQPNETALAASEIRRLLPASATTIIRDGKLFIALPEHEVDDWLADLVDAVESALALTDGFMPEGY